MGDPVSGPLSREELRALVDAPFGAATKAIRKHDPLFGRNKGEKFDWEVIANVTCQMRATVTASSQEEADKLADELTGHDFEFYGQSDDIDIVSVEPAK